MPLSPIFQKISALVLLCLIATASQAVDKISGLTIRGQYQPSAVGTFPVTANYSWQWLEFTGGAKFTWFFGPGTDGGIKFGIAQGHPPYDNGAGGGTLYGQAGNLSGEFLFLNEPSVYYSTGTGIGILPDNTIDMSRLMLFRNTTESSLGAGVNGPTVPLVADITALASRQSGWQINPDGSYHLIFHTFGLNAPMAIHLTGDVLYAPTVTGVWPGDGPPGTFVFVFGSHFTPDSKIYLNGIQAMAVQYVSPDMLILILPAGNTAGPLVVTTPQGSATAPINFGIPVTGLQITGVWPGSGTTNNVVFVFGSGFVLNQTSVSINTVTTSAVQVIDSRLLLFLLPAGTTSGPVTITTPSGSTTSAQILNVR